MTGDIEGDATGLRSTVIKRTNKYYQDGIKHLEQKMKIKDKVYRIWVRLLGIKERKTGKLLIHPIDHKICQVTAKPPPESAAEIEASGLLNQIKKPARLHSDGAPAWPAQVRGKAHTANVVHSKKQYTRDLADHEAVRGLSKMTGTQMVDRNWKTLCNSFIPDAIHAKVRQSGGDTQINENLFTYCWAFVLRHNLDEASKENLWEALGKVHQAWYAL